jgi:hypothetical protein
MTTTTTTRDLARRAVALAADPDCGVSRRAALVTSVVLATTATVTAARTALERARADVPGPVVDEALALVDRLASEAR